MHRNLLTFMALSLLPLTLAGQQLSTQDKALLDSARAKYYNLELHGLESFTCSVDFDFATIPYLPTSDKEADRKLLEATVFQIKVDRNGSTVQHAYPASATDQEQKRVAPTTNLLLSLISGLFQTWPSKGLRGPIPAFDSQIDGVETVANGYVIKLHGAGEKAHIELDKDYLVTRIVTFNGTIDETPIYEMTADGLIYTGNAARDTSNPSNPVDVHYEIKSATVDGLRLPEFIRLNVNQNIDTSFTLNKCIVSKGIVMKLKP